MLRLWSEGGDLALTYLYIKFEPLAEKLCTEHCEMAMVVKVIASTSMADPKY
jgi:hypothetical protein